MLCGVAVTVISVAGGGVDLGMMLGMLCVSEDLHFIFMLRIHV